MIDPTKITLRQHLRPDEIEIHRDRGTIIADDRRRRPLWFDGRFLEAGALTSEQNYFLSRQADIARVAGVGVVNGLMVEADLTKSRTIKISAGQGITPAGELVVLPEDIEVDLANVSENQELDASFGLAELPRQSQRNRSGIFIIGLRPVEYTAEPIASYPTSINGSRSVEDGSVIEATAVTLIPYPDQGARTEMGRRRKHVAREIFLEGSQKGHPVGVLPLAMMALNLGVIEWVDPYLVRREVGAAEHDIFGLGMSPRVLREAFLLQYHHHLGNILSGLQNGEQRFVATEHFLALPSAGPMPATAIDPTDFTQSYFPAEMNVDLTIVPEDELTSLLEDSLSLPPLDLTISGDEYESTSVMVMVPVPRHKVRKLSLSLKSVTYPLKAATPGLMTKRQPITVLTELSFKTIAKPIQTDLDSIKKVWREVLNSTETYWYTRRRNIQYRADIVALPEPVIRDETESEEKVAVRMKDTKMVTRFNDLNNLGTTAARAEIMSLLSTRTFLRGPQLAVKAAVKELEGSQSTAGKINRLSVLKVSERFSESKFGEGIARLEEIDTAFKENTVVNTLSDSGKVPELDRLVRVLPATKLKVFSKELSSIAKSTDGDPPKKVAKLVDERLKGLKLPSRIFGPIR